MSSRATERIPVRFDCTVRLGDEKKRCVIRNMSQFGVLTSWPIEEFVEIPFRVGDRFPLEIRLSGHQQFGEKGISCMGTVVRVGIDKSQVAFQISGTKLGALGLSAFGDGDPRSVWVM